MKKFSAEERFWRGVGMGPRAAHMGTACWIWSKGTNGRGYGRFEIDQRSYGTHRYSYALHFGEIPAGLEVEHRCHNRLCVRPDHLRTASRKQNVENTSGAQRDSRSGILGVTWHRDRGMWRAQVCHNYKCHHVGYFGDIEDARRAVIAKRNELFTHNELDRV